MLNSVVPGLANTTSVSLATLASRKPKINTIAVKHQIGIKRRQKFRETVNIRDKDKQKACSLTLNKSVVLLPQLISIFKFETSYNTKK